MWFDYNLLHKIVFKLKDTIFRCNYKHSINKKKTLTQISI